MNETWQIIVIALAVLQVCTLSFLVGMRVSKSFYEDILYSKAKEDYKKALKEYWEASQKRVSKDG